MAESADGAVVAASAAGNVNSGRVAGALNAAGLTTVVVLVTCPVLPALSVTLWTRLCVPGVAMSTEPVCGTADTGIVS